jgi:hypothetical protein
MLILTLVLGMLVLFSTPAVVGGPTGTPPAAVSFDVNFQVSGAAGGFMAELSGVANRSGDLRATLSTMQPETHTIDVIVANRMFYVSLDGAPYEAAPTAGPLSGVGAAGSALARGSEGTGGFPPECQASALGIGAILEDPNARSALAALAGIEDLGPATIDGNTTEHYSGSIDLGRLLGSPFIQQGITQAFSACGGGRSSELNPGLLQSFLTGSTASLDAYIDPATEIPRQFDFTLDLQPLSLQFTADGVASPLANPPTISAP